MNIIVSAISADFGRFSEEENCQRNTWASKAEKNVKVFWVKAKPELSKPVLDERNTLKIPGEESVPNVLRKRVLSTKYIMSNFNPEFLVLTNSSSYIDLALLGNDLSKIKDLSFFGGYLNLQVNPSFPLFMESFVNGGYMVLSRKAARSLVKLNPANYVGLADDLAISKFLNESGFQAKPLRISNVAEGKPFQSEITYFRIRHIAKPKITQKRMNEIYQLKQGTGSIDLFILKESIRMNREIAEYSKSRKRIWTSALHYLKVFIS